MHAFSFSSTTASRQATTTRSHNAVQQEPKVVDRSLIAPWFHELDDMPEERMCIVAPSTRPPAFPAMPVGDHGSNANVHTSKSSHPFRHAPSGKHSIHTSAVTYSPPDPASTPYASDDPTQPRFDRNKQIRSQAAWQETQQAGIACSLSPPADVDADMDARSAGTQPVADASNPTNAYGKLHPDDTHGRGHIGLGEHEHGTPAPLAGNWDDADLARKDTRIRTPDMTDEIDADRDSDEQVLPQKPEDFVGASIAWHPLANMLFGHHHATRSHHHGRDVLARGYATSTKPQVDRRPMPNVSEIVNPGGEGGAKPRIKQSMQKTVHVRSATVKEAKTYAHTSLEEEGEQEQDPGDEYQDGAIRNPHKELSSPGN
ncbi:hypothetical protein BCR44DRAFT_1428346 [Catenaria anguillulae PL171]|uniref:Uncharacterized protein n=1 Tax=Catenaria anguillulae PL171 TaxID=765915 RepID=A0A1Y2HZ91_9FUNG|nr:hypothetical protein BCR44DRAFT_1428346 [Catenaria anguillulae PL171]